MFCRLERVDDKKREEISVSGVDDVVMILKSDYENAYFVTGTLLYLKKCVLTFHKFYLRGSRFSTHLQELNKLNVLNYQLSQKLKLIRRGKFNHLIIILTLSLTDGLKLSFNR